VKLLDANVLLYAVNRDVPHHEAARTWLDDALDGDEAVVFCWVVMLAFLRISTHPGIFATPLSVNEAADVLDAWLSQPNAVVIEPTIHHFITLRTMLASSGTGGNLVTDAHLAAIALEQGADVVTFDADLTRFKVNVVRPE
jgi:toxin-antitoxin system PIN domain toxin